MPALTNEEKGIRALIWRKLADQVRQQHMFFDLMTRSWLADYHSAGGRIYCGKGCQGCCTLAVNTTLPEAVIIADSLSEAGAEAVKKHMARLQAIVATVDDMKGFLRMHRQVIGFCPFLTAAGLCSVYQERPLSCRSLLSTRESSWCSADFACLSAEERQAYMAALDSRIVAFPLHYVAATQETAREMETEMQHRMREAFGFSLYGSLPVLVSLVKHHGLAEACLIGREAAICTISSSGLDLPFLVSY